LDLRHMRGARIDLGDFLVRQDHVAPVAMLDAAHDVFLGDLAAGTHVDALVAHRIHAALVQPVEIDAAVTAGRMQAHRDVHQPEADRAFPQRAPAAGAGLAGHGSSFPSDGISMVDTATAPLAAPACSPAVGKSLLATARAQPYQMITRRSPALTI